MSFKDLMTYKRILIRHIYTSVISWWRRACVDWCYFYYFIRNSRVALLEALFARCLYNVLTQVFLWLGDLSLKLHQIAIPSYLAIFPRKHGRKREISNESARGSSLREANVKLSAKGAPHDVQDTVKTLRTIIWYKRACIRQTTRQSSLAVRPSKNGRQQKCRYRTTSKLKTVF